MSVPRIFAALLLASAAGVALAQTPAPAATADASKCGKPIRIPAALPPTKR